MDYCLDHPFRGDPAAPAPLGIIRSPAGPGAGRGTAASVACRYRSARRIGAGDYDARRAALAAFCARHPSLKAIKAEAAVATILAWCAGAQPGWFWSPVTAAATNPAELP